MKTTALKLQLPDIRCASCIATIENGLKNIPGIQRAGVNFAEKSITIEGILTAAQLIKHIQNLGYQAQPFPDQITQRTAAQRHEHHQLLKKAGAAGILGCALMILSMSQQLPSRQHHTFQLIWLSIAISALITMIYSGATIFRNAIKTCLNLHATMDTLIATGTLSAWLYSFIIVLFPHVLPTNGPPHLYFESALIIIALVNFGASLEMKAKEKTTEAIEQIINLQATTASVVTGTNEIQTPIEEVKRYDIIHVRPGEKIPLDGIIIEGATHIDESMLTGEPIPNYKSINDEILGGTINQTGSVLYQVTRIGEDTALAQIIHFVQQAQNSKPPIARFADKIAAYFVPTVMSIAIITALLWLCLSPKNAIEFSFICAMNVLIIACPCALGLATPISIMIAIGRAARHGILIQNSTALQQASTLTTIVLDKTGTITQGKPHVTQIIPIGKWQPQHILQLAASLEKNSEHPLASAIVAAAKSKEIELLPCSDFQSFPGLGVSALISDQSISLGNAQFMEQQQVNRQAISRFMAECNLQNHHAPLLLACNKMITGILIVADPVKEDSAQAIAQLKSLGLEVIMLTGDNRVTAHAVGAAVGIDKVIAEVLPQDKAHEIKLLQQQGKLVGMVGDGINDAPALTQAHLGFALSSGTDVAMACADIILLRSSLTTVIDTIHISTATMKNIKQNLFAALIYNAMSIPIAAGILYPFFGILLNPMIAGAAMVLSSLSVIVNANRLQKI